MFDEAFTPPKSAGLSTLGSSKFSKSMSRLPTAAGTRRLARGIEFNDKETPLIEEESFTQRNMQLESVFNGSDA